MGFEDMLARVGDFGAYQKLLNFLLVALPAALCASTYYTQILILMAPPHHCNPGNHLRSVYSTYNLTDQQALDLLLPSSTADGVHKYSTCEIINVDFEQIYNNSFQFDKQNGTRRNFTTMGCPYGWIYDSDYIFPNIATDNDWVCEENWRPFLIHSIFWIGNCIGAWLWGFMSDHHGRKPTVLMSFVVYLSSSLLTIVSTNFYYLLAMRFLVGTAHHTISHLPYVLVMEYCGVSKRTVPLFFLMVSYTMASISLPWMGYWLWNWKILVVVVAAPMVLIVLSWKLIPESACWLLAHGRHQEAVTALNTVAKLNSNEMAEGDIEKMMMKQVAPSAINKRESLLSLFRTPNLRKNTFLVNIVWMVSCLCYYGYCQNTANLGRDVFSSMSLSAVMEIPCWFVPFIIVKLGRRCPLIFTFIATGVLSLTYSILPPNLPLAAMSVALTGKMMATASYFICLQYAPEIFPTVIRGQSIALSETIGGIAIFLAPSIVFLGTFHRALPFLIFGGLALLGSAVALFLPETAGRQLPQTVAEAEDFGKDQHFWECVFTSCGRDEESQTAGHSQVEEKDCGKNQRF